MGVPGSNPGGPMNEIPFLPRPTEPLRDFSGEL